MENRTIQLTADGVPVGMNCRIRLRLRERLALSPQLFHLDIENLSEASTAQLLQSRRVEAVREGSVLAAGEILSACPRREAGRQILSVVFSPSFSLWQSSLSLSLAGGMRVSDSLRAVLAAALFPDGSRGSVPLAAFAAEDAVLTRPQAFFGRTCDALRSLAEAVRADVFVAPAGVCVMDRSPREAALEIPEALLSAEPIALPDRFLLSTEVLGWPLGASARFSWQGNLCRGRAVSRMLDLDTASGPWRAQLEIEREKD